MVREPINETDRGDTSKRKAHIEMAGRSQERPELKAWQVKEEWTWDRKTCETRHPTQEEGGDSKKGKD